MGKIKRIVVSGGGTGGHIYPALSIVEALKKDNPHLESLYIGTPNGLEATIVPKTGINFKTIRVQGLVRSLSVKNIKTVVQLVSSLYVAKRMLKEFKPDIVIGTGGYVCAPVLLAGSQLNIPTLIHEQNSVAGVTNKLLARFVDRICLCFEVAADDFSKYADKLRLTGNPRATEVVTLEPYDNILADQFDLVADKLTVLIFGGSRGAPAINQAALDAISQFKDSDYQVLIAVGQVHFDAWIQQIKSADIQLSDNVRVVPYIDNMPQVLNAVDLVISRSGATTLTELTALGKPSILVPSPYVTNNHQEYNARTLVEKGAAIMIKEADLTSESLVDTLNQLLKDPEQLKEMSLAAKRLGITDAIDRIKRVIDEIV